MARLQRIAALASAVVLGAGTFPSAGLVAQGRVEDSMRARWPDPRGPIFAQRGCTQCHAVTGVGVKALTDAAPDLTCAYRDVETRYGVSLEALLADPTGVMRMVLASHVSVTRSDRDSLVHILKRVYQEQRGRCDEREP